MRRSKLIRLSFSSFSDNTRPNAEASGMVRKALKKFVAWQVCPFCESNMWKRNPSSQDRQNSFLHKWFNRATLNGSI